MRSAEFLGLRKLLLKNINCDDHTGSCNASPLDDGQADSAGAEHGDRRPWLDSGGIQHCSHSSGDSAADESRAVERHIVTYTNESIFMDEHLLRVCRETGKLIDRRAFPTKDWRLLRGTGGAFLAKVSTPSQTVGAMATENRQTSNHMITWLELRHLRANRL